jgi:hypothetical protein
MATRKPSSSPTSSASPVVVHQPETRVRLTIEVSGALFDALEEQAIARGRMVEDEIADRLHRCKGHVDSKPLYLNDQQRVKLERALGHNFSDAETAISQILTATTLQVGDCGVELPPRLTLRLASRAKSMRKEYETYVREETIRGLMVSAGLLPQ